MAFRIKSYREKYFEDHVAVPDPKRPGKVKYVYSGDYVEPFVEGHSVTKWKVVMVCLEVVSIAIYLATAILKSDFNSVKLVGGLGIIAIVPWALEIWSFGRFIISSDRMEETTYESIGKWYAPSVLIRVFMLGVMIIYGALNLGSEYSLALSIISMAGLFASGVLSVVIWRMYKRVFYYTHRQHEEDYNPNYVKNQK